MFGYSALASNAESRNRLLLSRWQLSLSLSLSLSLFLFLDTVKTVARRLIAPQTASAAAATSATTSTSRQRRSHCRQQQHRNEEEFLFRIFFSLSLLLFYQFSSFSYSERTWCLFGSVCIFIILFSGKHSSGMILTMIINFVLVTSIEWYSFISLSRWLCETNKTAQAQSTTNQQAQLSK